jgi:hypothetical protein
VDPSGRYVAIDAQDRSLWDQDRIRQGLAMLERAVRLRHPGEYQLQAAITALQIQAPDAEATDWAQIAELYGALGRLNPSPVVELNRAVAVAMAHGPAAGLELADRLVAQGRLATYHLLPSVRGDLLGKLGRFVARRRAIAATYDTLFASTAPLIRPMARTRPCLPAWHLYAARIDFERAGISRASLMRKLAAKGIGTQVHYFPVHRQPYYAKRFPTPTLPGAERYYSRALSLPLSAAMTTDDAARVAETLLSLF